MQALKISVKTIKFWSQKVTLIAKLSWLLRCWYLCPHGYYWNLAFTGGGSRLSRWIYKQKTISNHLEFVNCTTRNICSYETQIWEASLTKQQLLIDIFWSKSDWSLCSINSDQNNSVSKVQKMCLCLKPFTTTDLLAFVAIASIFQHNMTLISYVNGNSIKMKCKK